MPEITIDTLPTETISKPVAISNGSRTEEYTETRYDSPEIIDAGKYGKFPKFSFSSTTRNPKDSLQNIMNDIKAVGYDEITKTFT